MKAEQELQQWHLVEPLAECMLAEYMPAAGILVQELRQMEQLVRCILVLAELQWLQLADRPVSARVWRHHFHPSEQQQRLLHGQQEQEELQRMLLVLVLVLAQNLARLQRLVYHSDRHRRLPLAPSRWHIRLEFGTQFRRRRLAWHAAVRGAAGVVDEVGRMRLPTMRQWREGLPSS